jgi:hypothetical protein
MANVPKGIPKDIAEFKTRATETKELYGAYEKYKTVLLSKDDLVFQVKDASGAIIPKWTRPVNAEFLRMMKKLIGKHWADLNKAYSMAHKGRRPKKWNPNTGFLRLQKLDNQFIKYIFDARVSMGQSVIKDATGKDVAVNNKDFISYLQTSPYGSAALMTTIFALIIRENNLARTPAMVDRKRGDTINAGQADLVVADQPMLDYLGPTAYPALTKYIQEKKPDFNSVANPVGQPTQLPDGTILPGKLIAPGWNGFPRGFQQTILTKLRTRSNEETPAEKKVHADNGLPPLPFLGDAENSQIKLDTKSYWALYLVLKNEESKMVGVKDKEKKFRYNWPQIGAMTAALVDGYGNNDSLSKIVKPEERLLEQAGKKAKDNDHYTLEEWKAAVLNNPEKSAALIAAANVYINDTPSLAAKHPAIYHRVKNDEAQQKLSQITSAQRAVSPKKKKAKVAKKK